MRMFLAAGATDLHKSFGGLGDLVTHQFKEDPLSGHLYVFTNRRRNRVKAIAFKASCGNLAAILVSFWGV